MGKVFEDTMTGLLQASAIEKGHIPVKEVLRMPAQTFRATNPDISDPAFEPDVYKEKEEN